MTTFADLGLAQKFLDALDAKGYTEPTPIQEQAIPIALAGKDMFGCAQTGTGKTAAFSLPTLQRLDATHDDSNGKKERTWIRSLILTPTRELAIQIDENLREYGKKSNLRTAVIYGGVSQVPQVKKLRKGVEILVATPGRLLDLVNQKHINLTKVEIFILDEADRMLDMGFIHDIKKVVNFITKKRQTLFFSATMAPSIMELAETFLTDPQHVEIAPASSTVDTVTQSLYTVKKAQKKDLLLYLLKNPKIKNAVVFTKTKHGANKVERILNQAKIPSAAIHGNKSQNARQKALKSLKDGSIRVLVATDVAARGIDVSQLSHVIIHDVPLEPESYVHRIGRTGRAGLKGEAMMFCEPEETKYLNQVLKLIGIDIPLVTDHPFHEMIDLSTNRSPKKSSGGRGRYGGKGNSRGSSRGGKKRSRSRQQGSREDSNESPYKFTGGGRSKTKESGEKTGNHHSQPRSGKRPSHTSRSSKPQRNTNKRGKW